MADIHKAQIGELVFVKYDDITSYDSGNTGEPNFDSNYHPMEMTVGGKLIQIKEKYVVLAVEYSDEDTHVRSVFTIPKGAINHMSYSDKYEKVSF
jgi:effector-binding domain-containing protein